MIKERGKIKMNISVNEKIKECYIEQNIEESVNLGLIALLIINNKISISKASEMMGKNINEVIEIFRKNNINWGEI